MKVDVELLDGFSHLLEAEGIEAIIEKTVTEVIEVEEGVWIIRNF